MEEKKPDRAERRRREKEEAKPQGKATCAECKEGPCDIVPKIYDKCPVCGCPNTFAVQAMKGDLHIEDLEGKQSALFSFEYIYETPAYKVKLIAIGASCARCGVFYTLARDKLKGSTLAVPRKPGGRGPHIILPGQAS